MRGSKEYSHRQAVFNANLKSIEHHNMYSNASWSLGVNQFSDLTPAEFKSHISGFNKDVAFLHRSRDPVRIITMSVATDDKPLPKSVDWRQKGVVTPVKNQGGCGSCWAFSTIETVESHVAISSGVLTELSEQQLVSCVENPDQCGGTGGCSGATMVLGFEYIQKNGIYDEWHYPYQSIAGESPVCKNSSQLKYPLAGLTGVVRLPSNQYEPLLQAVAFEGPIAITVDASSWGAYRGGVFDGCNRKNPDLNHGVQLVGYGEDEQTNEPYWLVRNSWGPNWGENGYIRLKRDPNPTCGTDVKPGDGSGCKGGPESVTVCGTCGILYDSSYPTGAFLHR